MLTITSPGGIFCGGHTNRCSKNDECVEELHGVMFALVVVAVNELLCVWIFYELRCFNKKSKRKPLDREASAKQARKNAPPPRT